MSGLCNTFDGTGGSGFGGEHDLDNGIGSAEVDTFATKILLVPRETLAPDTAPIDRMATRAVNALPRDLAR